ncbi:unnamed protein product, partial [Heterotrigona itama]
MCTACIRSSEDGAAMPRIYRRHAVCFCVSPICRATPQRGIVTTLQLVDQSEQNASALLARFANSSLATGTLDLTPGGEKPR